MPKLTRYLQKIFANNSNQVGVFGTGVDKETSKNVETLQSSDYEEGWSSAIITNKNYPIWQEMDGVQYGLSYQLKYLFQNGIPEWLSTETYYTNSYCRVGSNVYYSLQDNNTNHNPALNDGWWTPLLTSNRSIGEIVPSCIPLTDAGLHLLDGALISGSGSYVDFVDYIADLYNDTKVYNPSAFTVVGSPTITDDGVASGFSSSNYISISSFDVSKPWRVNLSFTTASDVSTLQFLFRSIATPYGIQFVVNDNKLWVGFNTSQGVVSLEYNASANTNYTGYIEWTGTQYNFALNGTVQTVSSSNALAITGDYNLGAYYGNTGAFLGSIDLKEFQISVDGVTVFSGSMPTGYFTDETSWQSSVSTYGVCGKFVYDSVNNTVRLPKITGIVEGTTDTSALGDLVEAGLPNITAKFALGSGSTASGAVYISGNTGGEGGGSGGSDEQGWFDASRSSSIYGNSTTVQPQTIKVLYYIVIATSIKTDIEVDIDEIATDLNGKADTDLSNVPTSKGILTESYANGTSWYRVYSDGWCEQGGIQTCSNQGSIALLKNYISTDYSVLFASNGSSYAKYSYISAYNKAVSGFNVAVIQGNSGASSVYTCWYAFGYIR